MDKVYGGTPSFGCGSLCYKCRNATVTRGRKFSDEIVMCGVFQPAQRRTFAVLTCSDYADKSQPPMWELEKIAWRFNPGDRHNKAGFCAPSQNQSE